MAGLPDEIRELAAKINEARDDVKVASAIELLTDAHGCLLDAKRFVEQALKIENQSPTPSKLSDLFGPPAPSLDWDGRSFDQWDYDNASVPDE